MRGLLQRLLAGTLPAVVLGGMGCSGSTRITEPSSGTTSAWEQTSGPSNVQVQALIAVGTTLFGSSYGVIFRSTDGCANWTKTSVPGGVIVQFVARGNTIFAGMDPTAWEPHVFRTTDHGATWRVVPGLPPNAHLGAVAATDSAVFVGGHEGVYRSHDGGDTWVPTPANTGLPSPAEVRRLAVRRSSLFALCRSGDLYRSVDNGETWAATAPTGSPIFVIAANETALFAGTGWGLQQSTDDGRSWVEILAGHSVHAIDIIGKSLFIGTYSGAFRSDDNGTTWSLIDASRGVLGFWAFARIGTDLLAGTGGVGVYRSSDQGASWSAVGPPISGDVTALVSNGTRLLAASGDRMFRTVDAGRNWGLAKPTSPPSSVRKLVAAGGRVFAGTTGGVFHTQDGGDQWVPASNGLSSGEVSALAAGDAGLFAAVRGMFQDVRIFRSQEEGATWTEISDGMPTFAWVPAFGNVPGGVVALAPNTGAGVFRLSDDGRSWVPSRTGIPASAGVLGLVASGRSLFVGVTDLGVYRSADGGRTWTAAGYGLPEKAIVDALASDGTTVFAAVLRAGVYRLDGTTWSPVGSGPVSSRIKSLAADGATLYAGTQGGGVWRLPY